MLTVYVSGLHSGPNPSPGVGVARSLRLAFPDCVLIGVDYSTASSGLHCEVFDRVQVARPWPELDLALHRAHVEEAVARDGAWISCLDLETRWLASGPVLQGLLIPPPSALPAVSKPYISAGASMGLKIPPFEVACNTDWVLHAFCRLHDWNVWLKGPDYEARRVTRWAEFVEAREELSESWSTDALFLQANVVGNEESIAFSAYEGELLDAVYMQKRLQTPEGKTWAGSVSEMPPRLAERLEAGARSLNWTGGGELECIRDLHGDLFLIDWNPRFPAWVYGATLAGHNLPGKLVEAAGFGRATPVRRVADMFTRIVVEVPARMGLPLPMPGPAPSLKRPLAKHPSGMPALAKRLSRSTPLSQDRAPRSPIPETVVSELAASANAVRTTPCRVLLSGVAESRFSTAERLAIKGSGVGVRTRIAYSVKTNPAAEFLKLALEHGFLAEVISASELRHVLRTGFSAEQVVINGPAQPPQLRDPRGPRFHAAFADSLESLARWVMRGSPRATFIGARLRLPSTDSRFGVDLSQPNDFGRMIGFLRRLPNSQSLALHFHVASDFIGVEQWWHVCRSAFYWAKNIDDLTDHRIECIDIGGGWFPEDFDRSFGEHVDGVLRDAASALPNLRQIVLEPGKALVQPSMAVLTRVVEVRHLAVGTCQAVVDAAISDLPMASQFPHRLLVRERSGRWEALGNGPDCLLGRLCMETDVLVRNVGLPEALREGDLLAICDTGAYDASMSYSFGCGRVSGHSPVR